MSRGPLAPGKLPPQLLQEVLSSLGAPPGELLVPPAIGEDACVIELAGGGALVAASDPITLTSDSVGAYAVVINANDVAVTGAEPRWFLSTVLLPPGVEEQDVRAIFADMQRELERLGAVLVGGHTEITSAVRQPVVVGQMLGLRRDGGFVRTGGARPGDVVLQVGPAPVEGAAVLATELAEAAARADGELLMRARQALREPGICVVEPALRCAALGTNAMHDPTEGGISAGLYELADASGVSLCGLHEDGILWFEPGLELCRAAGADPWGTLASGTLLACFSHELEQRARETMATEGYAVREIARVESGRGVWRRDGQPLARFERDELSRVLGR